MSTELVRTQIEHDLANGKIVKLADLTKALAKPPTPPTPPAKVPLPAEITQAQREALELLPMIFGSVVPVEKRALQQSELTTLLTERQTLDTVEKMASERKADIRTSIVNHFDVVAEEQGVPEGTWRDADGHILKEAHVNVESSAWSWEIREGSGGNLTDLALADLAADDSSPFSREDYLACTAQVRVVDENKLLLHLKKNPHLAAEIAKAVTPKGAPVGSLYVRKAKH